MKRWPMRFDVLTAPIIMTGLLISVSLFFLTGCGLFSSTGRENKQLYKEIGRSKGSLIKTLAVLPFENTDQWARVDLTSSFLKELKSAIEKKSGHVRVLLPGSPGFPAQFEQSTNEKNGEIDNYTLALAGRAAGVNMVLAGQLVNIRYVSEHRGIFWWGGTHHLARIQMEFSIYHTGTAAKLLDQTIIKDLEITESEGLQIEKKEMPSSVNLSDTLADFTKTIAKTGHAVIKYVPWESHVTSVNGDRLVLSSGESVGLKKGKVLDLFREDKVTRGRSGRRFFMEGSRIGAITLTAVYPDHSEAILKEGGPIPPGSVARLP